MPVILVGNITIGGAGKTPLVIALAQQLRAAGFRPGVVSRGYGGRVSQSPRRVGGDDDPRELGDEPVLIARRTGVPVVVCPDRVAAARRLLAESDCDLILSDDGMQHYRLGRDLELAVVDGLRCLGNGRLLPQGPLRESARRLREVDAVLFNGEGDCARQLADHLPDRVWTLGLRQRDAERLIDGARRPLTDFTRVRAVAGIGHPRRFFDQLRAGGLELIEHPLADHQPLEAGALDFDDDLPVLMTEKDGVKYRRWADARHWQVPVEAQLDPTLLDWLVQRIQIIRRKSTKELE